MLSAFLPTLTADFANEVLPKALALALLNFAIFLVNQHFYDRYKNETFKDEFLQDRTEIIKKIVNLNNINLNTSNIFYQIEQIVK